jgi:hypothetical protein
MELWLTVNLTNVVMELPQPELDAMRQLTQASAAWLINLEGE